MKYTLIVIMLASASGAYAQLGIGPKAGMNFTTLDFKNPEYSYNSRTGYHLGVFFRAGVKPIAIQPEILLFTQAGEIENNFFGTARETFTYLSIPVMLKFYPVGGFNLQVGPQFGFLLDGERDYNTFLGSGSVDITEYYKKSDVSISAGAGFDLGGLTIDLRYNIGVKDINNVANDEEAKSKVFMLSLGWNFFR